MAEDVKVVIGADVSGAVDGLKDVGGAAQEASLTFGDLKNKIKSLSTEMDGLSGQPLRTAAVQLRGLKDAVKEVNDIGSPAQENMENLKRSFEDLGRVATGEGFNLRSIASNFGLLGPEVTIAAVAFVGLVYAMDQYVQKNDKSVIAARELEEVLSKSSESAAEATINVEKMNAEFARSTSVSDRKKALEDYNKTFGETIGYAKDFDTAEQNLKDKTGDYIKAMSFRAQADAAYGLQKEAIAKGLKAQAEGESGFFAKAKAGIQAFLGDYTGVANTLGESNNEIVKESNDAADAYGALAKKAEDSFAALKKQSGGGVGKPPNADENIKYLNETKKLIEDISKPNTQPLADLFKNSAEGALGDINFQIYQDKLKKATADAAKGAITPETFKNYADALQAAYEKQSAPKLKSVVQQIEIDPQIQSELNKYESTVAPHLYDAFKKLPPIKTDIKVDPNFIITESGESAKQLQERFQKIKDTIKSEIADTLTGAAEAIGEGIAGGGLGKVLDSLGSLLGGALEAIGKAYVTTGTEALLAKTTFDAFLVANPALSIAAGIGLEIFGSVLKNSIGSKVKPMADGGIFTKPQFLVGEAGPEAILPLNKLSSYMKTDRSSNNNNMQVEVTGRISGRDLVLLHNRSNGLQGNV